MSNVGKARTAEEIQHDWDTNPRWKGITRNYTAQQVADLQGTVVEEHTLARRGAEILWDKVNNKDFVNSLGALTGTRPCSRSAPPRAVYLSGWRVAGDANLSGHLPGPVAVPGQLGADGRGASTTLCCVPTRSPASRVTLVENWLAPIVADAEAGFGGALNAYELQKAMIAAGAAGVHWEDQLASEKKWHLGGKVLIPTSQHIGP